ncbi:hypothetical protein MKK75_03365 [Methylobacterium sp. J-030]|uniref:hypothetical protein n=1 Tax=Methylobacterium sp. J-030 TaxID=2836627 RepID=UPI001FBA2ED0|nr:hypothetical protein [Methylobacterium sp. J-030]MCJ2067856.1 hypothetical protein [Methylobacterium sp. J-030]
MKTQIGGAILAGSLVAGCATYPPRAVYLIAQQPGLSRDENRCTDIISTGGGVLKFCQTENNVNIYESGIDLTAERRKLDIVNNPKALLALQKDITVRPDLRTSRKLVAKACVVNDTRYVTISLDSLKKILDATGSSAVDADTSRTRSSRGVGPVQISSPRSDIRRISLIKAVDIRTAARQE